METRRTLTYKAEGAIRFSKQRYYEIGNSASRLLAFQLQKAQSSRIVTKITHSKTKEFMTSPKDIAEAFRAFFKELYADSDYNLRNEQTFKNTSTIIDGEGSTRHDKTNNRTGSLENYKVTEI